MAWLRQQGAEGPTDNDYGELQRQGLAIRGAETRNLIPTPRGRQQARQIAEDIARLSGAHRAVRGIKNRIAYWRCTCGVSNSYPLSVRGATSLVAREHDSHMRAVSGGVSNAPVALGSPGDCAAAMRDRIAAWRKAYIDGEPSNG